MTTALILFAHGARDPEWAEPLRRVQAAIRWRLDSVPVELAFIEFMAPNLTECAAADSKADSKGPDSMGPGSQIRERPVTKR